MRKIIIITSLFFLVVGSLGAQKEAAYWFFGENQGLNFSNLQTKSNVTINGVPNQTLSGIPSAIKGPIFTDEGCFAISDKDGNYLFSSDGKTIYNGTSNTNVMKNGTDLMGHFSANQSGIVIPRPKHPGKYYVITVPCRYESLTKEIFYSEVDFTVNNAQGQGEVIADRKNIKLNLTGLGANQAYENITGVSNANGVDYWLVHRARNKLFVWLITENGFTSSDPYKIFTLDYDPGAPSPGGSGMIKFSQDGKKLVNTSGQQTKFFVADFDPSTGTISNIVNRSFPVGTDWYFYSAEFSPNGEYLYIGAIAGVNTTDQGILVFPTNAITTAPTTMLYRCAGTAIQTGPDQRLYTMNRPGQNIIIILNPDEGGTQIAEVPNHLSGNPRAGLPNFIPSFSVMQDMVMDPPNGCINQELTFSMKISAGTGVNTMTKVEWDFGDGSPIVEITNMNQLIHSKTHTYTEVGTYIFTVTPYRADGTVLTDKIQKHSIKVSTCMLPVNPNIY